MSLIFDEVAELYDRARPRYPSALIDDLIGLSHVPEGGKILEVGCGTGQMKAPMRLTKFTLLTCVGTSCFMAIDRGHACTLHGTRYCCSGF